ncbi:family 16 glycosylhydrolase [Chitinispirillales bacterium ANBcel5]|uniref:family 16 glycosylhydrolase n=1 Tax=Cellulosispirillum alkaliphilum TaxID=3039283 RepID=UPI002A582055|nr:family 16 glycosylhydrolase [Chitinispirillales bacterium ANBcel5]
MVRCYIFFIAVIGILFSANGQDMVRGGELFSSDQQLYGRYEVRMKTAEGSGILSTFFTFENDSWMPESGNPWREIDIEVLGRYDDRFQTNIITGTAENRDMTEYYPRVDVNPHDSYNTYGIEWTPDYIAFFFNGEEVRRTELGDTLEQVEACRDIPQSYRFNMWTNDIEEWVGEFDPAILPRFQFINWIKYYSYDEQTGEFSLEWEDNFETFDSSRWNRATHIIENSTQFDPENVINKDGKLILALTDSDGNGLDNIVVPQDEADQGTPANGQNMVRGGELFSSDQQLYGRYEVRMKTAEGSGILSTFFTFENDGWMPESGNPWREIDIEVLGKYDDRFQTNIITGTAENRDRSEYYPRVDVNPHDSYNTYGIEWTPDYIAFFFNGEEVRRTELGEPLEQVEACRDIPQSYRFNMWTNDIEGWVGEFDPAIHQISVHKLD